MAIAPPPSLTVETPSPPPPPVVPTPAAPNPGFSLGGYGASSVAAKIMAKYGFKVILCQHIIISAIDCLIINITKLI